MIGSATGDQSRAIALAGEPKRLGGDDLADRERVVNLEHVHFADADARLPKSLIGHPSHDLVAPGTVGAVVPQGAASEHRSPDPHVAAVFAVGAEDRGSRPIGD